MEDYVNKVFCEDFLHGLSRLPDNSVDMILTDLPYGKTKCDWDKIIPADEMWAGFYRVIKDDRAIVLNSSQPFTTYLISSNMDNFRYCWYWNKKFAGNFVQAKRVPLKIVEEICVFSKGKRMPEYHPQMTLRDKPIYKGGNKQSKAIPISQTSAAREFSKKKKEYRYKYPENLITFNVRQGRGLHPTQKPVDLNKYLIKTYTEPGELVLDCCMGSGTTAVAAMLTGRNYVGFELDEAYCDVIAERVIKAKDAIEIQKSKVKT